MVNAHAQTQRTLPAEVFFACWLPPIVLVSWPVALAAAASSNLVPMAIAMLVGLAASAMSPMGLFLSIRAYRSSHPADERAAILFALIGNVLVVVQVVLILVALAYRS